MGVFEKGGEVSEKGHAPFGDDGWERSCRRDDRDGTLAQVFDQDLKKGHDGLERGQAPEIQDQQFERPGKIHGGRGSRYIMGRERKPDAAVRSQSEFGFRRQVWDGSAEDEKRTVTARGKANL